METTLAFARRIAARLGEVPGVQAVSLGGSFARGRADRGSDLDLGIYYDPAAPLDLARLSRLARELDDRHPRAPLTPIGGWGPWINGGGWLRIGGRRVDWIYRDLRRVARAIEEARRGRIRTAYQPGHPHAFHSHVYAGEVHHGVILNDRRGRLARLQARTRPYPAALRRAIRDAFLWEARFALDSARASVVRADVFHAAGALFRSAACLVQVLFAINGRYVVTEKRGLEEADSLARRPARFGPILRRVLARPGSTPAQLSASFTEIGRLVAAVETLAGRTR